MGHRSSFSWQTLAVLAELCATPSRWRHGYGLAKVTGLKSGTLYPVLVRRIQRSARPVTPRRQLRTRRTACLRRQLVQLALRTLDLFSDLRLFVSKIRW